MTFASAVKNIRMAICISTFVCFGASAAITNPTDPMAAVREYVDAFNKGDIQAMAATCANPTSILDGLAPRVWQGPTACQDWFRDVLAAGEHEGASG